HLSRHFFKIFGQQRLNYQVAQRYVFDVPTDTNVVAGSSMAEKLDDELLGPSFCKLTLPGGSVFTSLEMISLAQKHPRIIFIETNVLSRDSDKDLLHDLFNPWMAVLRRRSNIFREEGRPSNFVAGFADACVQKSG